MRAARGIDQILPYRVPRHPAPTDLHLSGNEGPTVPGDVLHAWASAERIRRYPDASEVEALLAARFQVAPERVIVTAGADDALARVIRAVTSAGARVVLPTPTFEMIERYVELADGEPIRVPWNPGDEYPLAEVRRAIDDKTAAIFIVTPNNPTGAAASAQVVSALLQNSPEQLVIVDHAYGEYGDEDLTSTVVQSPNGVLVRTLSKAWGLAGLRVGYAIGPAEVINWMRAVGQPFAVSSSSLSVAAELLRLPDQPWIAEHVAAVRAERPLLTELLRGLGAKPYPSQANFVLAEFSDPTWAVDGLAGMGITVRHFPSNAKLAACLRITCPGDSAKWERLIHALQTVLSPEAMILDMDGVLADTSCSFREAIRLTADAFGVTLTGEDIRAAKAAGHANDDWELTYRLILQHGGTATLSAVTAHFEQLYQGTDERPGLWRNETLLVPRDQLAAMESSFPLAIVTGRPRRDAERFVQHYGIADLFRVIVTREDAPLKPNPAPVRLALHRLGVRRAWMFGDTPDDARAARAAGVLPIGVIAPGDGGGLVSAIYEAGAGRILNTAQEIEPLVQTVSKA